MQLNIDYHFHPNLSINNLLAQKKVKKIRKKFTEKNINCILSTEHSYKNPQRAYQIMNKYKPSWYFCFPWMECITKDWIDIIVFSYDKKIFKYEELKPFRLTYFELIDFIKSKNDLYSFVTHPYSLNLSWVVSKLWQSQYKTSLQLLKAVEISNWAFDNFYLFLKKTPLNKIFHKKIDKILKTKTIPVNDYSWDLDFIAVWSDAHHINEIGNCCSIYFDWEYTDCSVFEAITTRHKHFQINFNQLNNIDWNMLLRSGLTSFQEFLLKKYYKYTTWILANN